MAVEDEKSLLFDCEGLTPLTSPLMLANSRGHDVAF